MQSDQHFHSKNAMPPLSDQVDNNYGQIPVAPVFCGVLPPATKNLGPFNSLEFQPSEACPKNFIIFNQTKHRSQIMFHPTFAQKFGGPTLNMHAPYVEEDFRLKDRINEREMSSPLKEDSDDIDALLSSEGEEEEQEEEFDEEEVSTARTHWNYESTSPEYSSTHGSNSKKNRLSSSIQKPSVSGSSYDSGRKQQKLKNMVKALKGIVPGGEQMNTVTVLDEAVKYLKSLKAEVQKLGIGDLKY